jgi:hypothetical protein
MDTGMQRQAAIRAKAFGDVRGAGVRRSATAGQLLGATARAGVKGVRKARKVSRRKVKPFRWHV